jgi:hypothetical protein
MRIISKKNDYYDSAQAFGQDQSVIYTRKGTSYEINPKELLPEFKFYSSRLAGIEINTNLIGFCGKIYPVFNFELPTRTTRFYVYTVQEVEKLLAKYRQKKALVDWNTSNYWGVTPRQKMQKYIDTWMGCANYTDIFIKYNAPIWYCTREQRYKVDAKHYSWKYVSKLIINPSNLKVSNFFRVINSFEAYQEIAMFLESTLAKEKVPDPTNVPDCYLAAAKGFDSWSFRKQPTKKGRKAKKRSVKCK